MTNKSIRDYINLIENAQREEVSESIGQEALRKDREAKAEWIKNNPLMKDKNPVQQQAAWAIYSTFHKPDADKKKEENVTEDGIESWSGNPSDRSHSGHESYMTPEYMLAHYKKRLAQIAAGKHKYPKEVAQLQAKIAKLEKQVATEEQVEESTPDAIAKIEQLTRRP